MHKRMKNVTAMMSAALVSAALSGCSQQDLPTPGVEESGYTVDFPVQQGGEQIDVLVRIRDNERSFRFKLILVERDEWSPARKARLYRIKNGRWIGDTCSTPYPFKMRIRIDAMDENRPVHVDEVITERYALHSRSSRNNQITWRAQLVYSLGPPPGVYRVRIDNLTALPEIDFQTLFRFERDNRKY